MLLCLNIGQNIGNRKIRKLCLTVPESDWLLKDQEPLNEDSRKVREGDIHAEDQRRYSEYVTS